uniref:CAF1 family ribonuclease n=1 Tax=Angiostrongylus cantonensis TaxID=6313 RepID=A0A158PB34_ANGCA
MREDSIEMVEICPARLENIQVIEVCGTNFNMIWPYLMVSLRNADFIALDLELSGLGARQASSSKNVVDRYKALSEAARTRGVLSIGLAFFKKSGKSETKRCLKFSCQVFNILSFCAEPFIVEPEALEFLAKHAFDFNRLIDVGVRYYPSTVLKTCSLRSLMTEMWCRSVPLFFHNGLVDLAFIYHHFYSPLPESFGEFCNAIADLYPLESPICDTKYLAEYQSRIQRDNVSEALASRFHLEVVFDNTVATMAPIRAACETVTCRLPEDFPHHLQSLLQKERLEEEEEKTHRERISVDDMKNKPRIAVTGCHRAGVDAFMTGFAALFQARVSLYRGGRLDEQQVNRIPLPGKGEPLVIQRTQFAGSCKIHESRFANIQVERTRNSLLRSLTKTDVTSIVDDT